MSLKQIISIKAVIVIFLLVFCHQLFAQTENQDNTKKQETVRLKKYGLFDNSQNYQFGNFVYPPYFNSPLPAFKNYNQLFFIHNNFSTENLTFSQNRFESIMPGLGSIKHYTNRLRWNTGKNTTFDFGVGLAMQNSVLDAFIPNYQISFKATLEYNFNDRWIAYFYGQYITKPINKPDGYFDPLMYNNPMFIQSEIGAGVKTGIKKTNIDFQINSIYVKEFGGMIPLNSKLKLGF